MSLQSSWPNCLTLPSGLFLTRSTQYSPKQWATSLQPTAFCSLCKTTVTAIYLEWTNDGTFSHITLPGGVNSRVRLAIGLLRCLVIQDLLMKGLQELLINQLVLISSFIQTAHQLVWGEYHLYYTMLKLAKDSVLNKGCLLWIEGSAHLKLLTAKSLQNRDCTPNLHLGVNSSKDKTNYQEKRGAYSQFLVVAKIWALFSKISIDYYKKKINICQFWKKLEVAKCSNKSMLNSGAIMIVFGLLWFPSNQFFTTVS